MKAPTLSQPSRASTRGFTLVELMVALSGGLFLSIVVFALARDASRFYQREGRMTTATLAGMIGFERLKSDIERAGYLSTPNIQRDPNLATTVDAGTPAALFGLAALRITPDTPNLSGNASFALNTTAGQTLTPIRSCFRARTRRPTSFRSPTRPPGKPSTSRFIRRRWRGSAT